MIPYNKSGIVTAVREVKTITLILENLFFISEWINSGKETEISAAPVKAIKPAVLTTPGKTSGNNSTIVNGITEIQKVRSKAISNNMDFFFDCK